MVSRPERASLVALATPAHVLHKVHHRFRVYDGPVPEGARALEDEGYYLARGLFGRRETAKLKADIERVFDEYPPDARAGSASPEIAAMFRYEMFNRSKLCQRMIGDWRILEIVEPLLGPDCHVIANTAWRNDPDHRHTPNGQEWHTDGGPHVPRAPGVPWPDDIPYPVFAVATHIFLQDCALEDGPTALVRGSHKSGLPPSKEDEWELELSYDGNGTEPCLAESGDVAFFVSDVWHRRLPPQPGGKGRFFLQTNYARRDIAQRVRPTSRVNHVSDEARARANTEREQLLLGLHPERFYDG